MADSAATARGAWEASCQRARSAIAALDRQALDLPTDTPGWTVRNLAAHIAASDSLVVLAVKPLSQGKNMTPLPLPAFVGRKIGDMINRRVVKKHAEARTAELLALIDSEHEKAVAALDAAPVDGWDKKGGVPGIGKLTLAELVAGNAKHYDEHVAVLQRAVGASTA
jgi:Mycothiol maleylpyruvate isomerase N-terminal domain